MFIYYVMYVMFNPTLPNNALPLLPGVFEYEQKQILKAALKANNTIAKLNGLARLLPNAELLITPLLIKESVESNAIENINTTTIKVLQSEAVYAGKITSWPEKEVLYYRQALLYWQEKIVYYGWLPTVLLIEMQSILEPNKTWIRTIPGTIIANAKKQPIYTPPEGEEVIRALLTNLETFIHQDDDIDPLIKVAVVHFQFESIHPFYDGNGRTWRILMMLYLLLTKKLEYPILFLSEYINKTRAEYYRLLNYTNQTNDYTDFILYILHGIEQQSITTQEKIVQIHKLMDETQLKIQQNSSIDYHKITKILFSYPFISMSKFREKMEVTKPTVSKYMNTLESLHIVKTIKVGRKVLVYMPDFIDLLV